MTVVIIDRGIDYDHHDFLNPDGSTRIKAILHMSGQSYCSGSRSTLEVNPTLTGAQVKQILRDTATADEFTGQVPNDQWGYGKLNIIAAVEAAAGS